MAKIGSAKMRHARAAERLKENRPEFGSVRPLTTDIHDWSNDLTMHVNRQGAAAETYNLSSWKCAPRLALPFANAAARCITRYSTKRSRRVFIANLSDGFFSFLHQSKRWQSIGVEEIAAETTAKFISWIDGRTSSTGKPYGLDTKRHFLGALRSILKELKKAGADLNVSDIIPSNPWPGQAAAKQATEPLTPEEARMLGEDLLAQVLPILDNAEGSLDRLSALDAVDTAELDIFDDQAACASLLLRHYGGCIPERRTIATDKSLPSGVAEAVAQHGIGQLTPFLGPSPADLVPLVNYLAFYTAFNEQPLLDLKLSEIQFESAVAGRMLLPPYKNRARRRVRRTFADEGEADSPVRVVRVLARWTERLREIAPPTIADDLFLYVPKFRSTGREVRSLSSRCQEGEADFRNHQAKIGPRVGIGYVGLRRVRVTAGDVVLDATNGDLMAAAAVLGHKNIATTAGPYRGQGAKKSSELVLAGAIAQRQRYLDSKGVVDARRNDHPSERSAATPGWWCLDPLDSPIPGQTRGKPCTAYPFCPDCPLGQLVSDQPLALARSLQLANKLEVAEQELGPRPWRERFGRVYSALVNRWIPLYDRPRVRAAAEALRLSPLPDVE